MKILPNRANHCSEVPDVPLIVRKFHLLFGLWDLLVDRQSRGDLPCDFCEPTCHFWLCSLLTCTRAGRIVVLGEFTGPCN